MNQGVATTSQPPRRTRHSLNQAVILDAAESVIAGSGLEMSMRDLARHLRASPMSLYRHFPSRDDLINALLDRVMSRFEAPPITEDWKADLLEFARRHRAILRRHPWAVPMLFKNPSPGLGTSRIGEIAFSILERGRMAPTDSVAVFSSIVALNYGWESFTHNKPAAASAGQSGEMLRESLEALSPEEYPSTRRVATELSKYGDEVHYEIAINHLVGSI